MDVSRQHTCCAGDMRGSLALLPSASRPRDAPPIVSLPPASRCRARRLPTPIQAEAVPLILGGGDVMAAAETGSGKTGAFALPVLQIVHETLRTRQQNRAAGTGSNGSGQGGGGGSDQQPPACVLNSEDRDPVFAISPDGLRCQARSEQAWGGCRGTVGAFGGKVYYEATVADEGLCR